MRFVHTNVLRYAGSILPEEEDKRLRARNLLAEIDLAVSVRVFQESYHRAGRATRQGWLYNHALPFLESYWICRCSS